jgi:hypothetical protein
MTSDPEDPAGRAEKASAADPRPSLNATFRDIDLDLDALVAGMAATALRELSGALEQIRLAPVHLRPTLGLAIPLILARSGLSAEMNGRILAAVRTAIERLPDRPARSSGR